MIYYNTSEPNKYNYLKKEIFPYKTCYTKKRYGGKHDGSYVFLEELINDTNFIYSYGINTGMDAIKFDLEMAENGKIVFMYDGSIEQPSYIHKNFRFTKEFVTTNNLYKHLEQNLHLNETRMALKIDIDGNEYELFNNNIEFISKHFNQISLELHSLIEEYPQEWKVDDLNLSIMKNKEIKKLFFKNINKYYNIIHIHANNHGPRYIDFPGALEILFLRKDYEILDIDNQRYPIENLDYQNYLGREDYVLDWWVYN
ncbi:MAG: Ostreococcus lucimarinus virus 1 [Pseudomonadota bacterium]|jgi:hypothetical protein